VAQMTTDMVRLSYPQSGAFLIHDLWLLSWKRNEKRSDSSPILPSQFPVNN